MFIQNSLFKYEKLLLYVYKYRVFFKIIIVLWPFVTWIW